MKVSYSHDKGIIYEIRAFSPDETTQGLAILNSQIKQKTEENSQLTVTRDGLEQQLDLAKVFLNAQAVQAAQAPVPVLPKVSEAEPDKVNFLQRIFNKK